MLTIKTFTRSPKCTTVLCVLFLPSRSLCLSTDSGDLGLHLNKNQNVKITESINYSIQGSFSQFSYIFKAMSNFRKYTKKAMCCRCCYYYYTPAAKTHSTSTHTNAGSYIRSLTHMFIVDNIEERREEGERR